MLGLLRVSRNSTFAGGFEPSSAHILSGAVESGCSLLPPASRATCHSASDVEELGLARLTVLGPAAARRSSSEMRHLKIGRICLDGEGSWRAPVRTSMASSSGSIFSWCIRPKLVVPYGPRRARAMRGRRCKPIASVFVCRRSSARRYEPRPGSPRGACGPIQGQCSAAA